MKTHQSLYLILWKSTSKDRHICVYHVNMRTPWKQWWCVIVNFLCMVEIWYFMFTYSSHAVPLQFSFPRWCSLLISAMPSPFILSSRALIVKNRKCSRIKHSVPLSMKPPQQTHLMALRGHNCATTHWVGTYGRVIGANFKVTILSSLDFSVCLFVSLSVNLCYHIFCFLLGSSPWFHLTGWAKTGSKRKRKRMNNPRGTSFVLVT